MGKKYLVSEQALAELNKFLNELPYAFKLKIEHIAKVFSDSKPVEEKDEQAS